MSFRVYFNRRLQWLNFFLESVTPQTFHRQGGGRWGYYLRTFQQPRRGEFGEIHHVESRAEREDSIVHELAHAWIDILRMRQGSDTVSITLDNEEKYISILDGLVRNFYREYRKL